MALKVIPSGQNRPIFDNMALYFECRINKKALLQTVFLAILSTGFVPHGNVVIIIIYF